jgi:hypothetical protein
MRRGEYRQPAGIGAKGVTFSSAAAGYAPRHQHLRGPWTIRLIRESRTEIDFDQITPSSATLSLP